MDQPTFDEEMLTLEEAVDRYGVKRSTLYRYIRRGDLMTYRRAMDKRVYLSKTELELVRRFRRSEGARGLTVAAVERARAFQRRTFGERVLSTSSAAFIEEDRRERSDRLP